MDTPQFTVEDFDEALSWFSYMHPSLSYDRKQVGRAVTHTIYDSDGEQLGRIGIFPARDRPGEVWLSTYSKAANAGLQGPWLGFGSMMDPKRAFNKRDRRFRTICKSFFAHFRSIHHLDKKVDGQATGLKLLDLGETTGDGVVRSTGGRPRHTENDWAYHEIEAGRDQAEVYKEWLEKIPESQRRLLADPLASFKTAMRYRRKGKKRD